MGEAARRRRIAALHKFAHGEQAEPAADEGPFVAWYEDEPGHKLVSTDRLQTDAANASVNDRIWFEKNPGRQFRIRARRGDEFAPHVCADGPGSPATVIMAISDGQRCRMAATITMGLPASTAALEEQFPDDAAIRRATESGTITPSQRFMMA